MSALLDAFAQEFERLKNRDVAGLGATRREAMTAALRDGLPSQRAEAWKYTSLRALERRRFAATDGIAVDSALLDKAVASVPMPRMVFVDGRFDAARSDVAALPTGIEALPLSRVLREQEPRDSNFLQYRYSGASEVFSVVNAALAVEGAVIRVDHGTETDIALHLVFVSSGAESDIAVHVRNFIDLRNDAALSLVEHHIALGEHRGLVNQLSHVHLGQRAKLMHARAQSEATGANLIARTDAVLARDTEYHRLDLELGAALSRHEFNVRLEGDGARLHANGVLLADGRRHIDTRLGIEHIARDTACQLVWRGLGSGRARVVFHGGITIREGADGSDADLSNKNLLLSADAEIDSQPVLVIHADEVKAAHGATVGQLDPASLFYLRSRGIPQEQARTLLTAAFCRETLAVFDGNNAMQETLQAVLDNALERIAIESEHRA